MARTGGTASLTELREAVGQKATSSSLRQTATDIGMSWSGLRTFLNGTTPHPATIKKISDWYLRQVVDGREDDSAAFEMALDVLTKQVAPSRRSSLRRTILDTITNFIAREQRSNSRNSIGSKRKSK